jgi:hypothetical protein
MRFTLRQTMIAVAITALVFAFIYYNTVGSFYGPGGQLDREYAEAERIWKSAHPGQPYPTLAPVCSEP